MRRTDVRLFRTIFVDFNQSDPRAIFWNQIQIPFHLPFRRKTTKSATIVEHVMQTTSCAPGPSTCPTWQLSSKNNWTQCVNDHKTQMSNSMAVVRSRTTHASLLWHWTNSMGTITLGPPLEKWTTSRHKQIIHSNHKKCTSIIQPNEERLIELKKKYIWKCMLNDHELPVVAGFTVRAIFLVRIFEAFQRCGPYSCKGAVRTPYCVLILWNRESSIIWWCRMFPENARLNLNLRWHN